MQSDTTCGSAAWLPPLHRGPLQSYVSCACLFRSYWLIAPLLFCAARHLYSFATGVALLYYPFGNGLVLALIPSLLTYLAMWRIREYASTLAWLVDFTYLIAW